MIQADNINYEHFASLLLLLCTPLTGAYSKSSKLCGFIRQAPEATQPMNRSLAHQSRLACIYWCQFTILYFLLL